MHALFDFDILRYSIGFASQKSTWSVHLKDGYLVGEYKGKKALNEATKEFKITDYITSEVITLSPTAHWEHSLRHSILKDMKAAGCDTVIGYLTESPNARVVKYSDYKSNRKNSRRPVYYPDIGKYMVDNYATVISDNIEADDALADAQALDLRNTVVISSDKDMNTFEGWKYNPKWRSLYYVTKRDARMWFWCQMIIGDTADAIKGIPGKGTAAAQKLFMDKSLSQYEGLVKRSYLNYYKDKMLAKAAFDKNYYLLKIGNRGELYNEYST